MKNIGVNLAVICVFISDFALFGQRAAKPAKPISLIDKLGSFARSKK